MGGCFCCTNGGSVENGLGMLLMTQRPDRVLIEPTSLGHVRRILRKENNGSGYSSCGWLFNGDELFRMEPLQGVFKAPKGGTGQRCAEYR